MTAEEFLNMWMDEQATKGSGWDDRAPWYNADLIEFAEAYAEAREKELREALRKLANEASGFMSMAVREVHGNTNMRVLELRITEARELFGEVAIRGAGKMTRG